MPRRLAPPFVSRRQGNRKPYLSLQSKLLVLLGTLLLGGGLLIWQQGAGQLKAQQHQFQASRSQELQQLLLSLLAQERRHAASQVAALSRDQPLLPEVLAARLLARWPVLQQDWQWRGLRLSEQGRELVSLGEVPPWPDRDRGDLSRLFCLNACYQQLSLQLTDSVQLELTLGLSGVLQQLHQGLGLDLALLRPGPGQRLWGLGIAQTATRPGFVGQLARLDKGQPFQSQVLAIDDRRWLLWWQPLEELSAGLVVVADISELDDSLLGLRNRALLAWWGLGGLVCLLLGMGGWRLAGRLEAQIQALPHLAERPQQAPQPGSGWLWRDQLDDLEEVTADLALHLDKMQVQVKGQLEMLEYRLRYDPLTGLANRAYLEEKIALLLSLLEGEELAVIFVDIQQFKAVNDSLGYEQGDVLLREVAGRLREAAKACQGLGRFSGDKFVVLLKFRDRARLQLLLDQLQWQLQVPVALPGSQCQVSAVLGVACLKDADLGPGEALRRADLALHHAKEQGLALGYYNQAMQDRLQARLALERDLIEALKLQQFELYLQPKYRLDDGELVGFEGLIRWHHPRKGLVSPQAFIPQLEGTDRIIDLGYWIIEEALAILTRLEAAGFGHCHLAVNLACRQFLDASLPTFVSAALQRHQLSPSQLELEVTESSLVDHFDNAMASLNALKALGVTIAIDDFGTGYSSLSYLRRLPFDVVKIDRSFVASLGDPASEQIVTSLVDLVHNLGGQVVAEGIETRQQLQQLQELGCDLGQGLLLGPAVPETELLRRQGPNLLEWPRVRAAKPRQGSKP
ncbi:putative bifunctional diguanylate cyclase/phosphodiesterase [Gallaecimonas xiamenensis]|uniref:Diguanylate cyclase n=1 Tax=Gallaecimonas xiamenensis 3-C-1 TaxID=745411 RepID=K2JMT3_9GAMM|nr:bifunctional diguanylate cyclase/phosphodiesterase [Gallaecimonas xiamenensis]EKE75727.1 diguanylate cyclase [Gallaecimonas xiamenensis 3-C-1]